VVGDCCACAGAAGAGAGAGVGAGAGAGAPAAAAAAAAADAAAADADADADAADALELLLHAPTYLVLSSEAYFNNGSVLFTSAFLKTVLFHWFIYNKPKTQTQNTMRHIE
jgi:hypothetical protein